jgi:hypothetical protein|tara:strand:+ start:5851 stop:6039 length:189 start_codon:yes stop_codon:yes gene_type:complete
MANIPSLLRAAELITLARNTFGRFLAKSALLVRKVSRIFQELRATLRFSQSESVAVCFLATE